mmetsp:Transcript_20701/g.45562  ORF Transcript_20701/g.45562 Transcript_20701/m.45562 type:complete len:219 (-) Transcript_20701:592-1248(-)
MVPACPWHVARLKRGIPLRLSAQRITGQRGATPAAVLRRTVFQRHRHGRVAAQPKHVELRTHGQRGLCQRQHVGAAVQRKAGRRRWHATHRRRCAACHVIGATPCSRAPRAPAQVLMHRQHLHEVAIAQQRGAALLRQPLVDREHVARQAGHAELARQLCRRQRRAHLALLNAVLRLQHHAHAAAVGRRQLEAVVHQERVDLGASHRQPRHVEQVGAQ